MAMYENLGYCPSNILRRGGMDSIKPSKFYQKTMEKLGDRVGYMVYAKGCNNSQGANIHELFMRDELGYDLSLVLCELIPVCKYAEVGKKILITDVINPEQINGSKRYESLGFLVSLEMKDEHLEMLIFKKPAA